MNAAALAFCFVLAGCSANDPNCAISQYGNPEHMDNLHEVMTSQDRCLDHWAKVYAKSKEPAGDVADGAVAQCSGIAQMLSNLTERDGSSVAKTSLHEENRIARETALTIVFRYRERCR